MERMVCFGSLNYIRGEMEKRREKREERREKEKREGEERRRREIDGENKQDIILFLARVVGNSGSNPEWAVGRFDAKAGGA
jgi:hypothetical protein